jgi:hypothetical protein
MTDVFGESPFFDVEFRGGEIGTQSLDSSIQMILIISLIFFIIWLIYRIVRHIKFGNEDYNQRKTHHYFDNIHGDIYDDEAKQAINYGEAIENPRAIDHYRIGAVYLVNARDPRRAHDHFTQALNDILDGNVDTREAPFIINRIDDFKDHFLDFPDIEELPIQNALIAYFNQNTQQIAKAVAKRELISEDDPSFRQKVMLSRQEWQSDSQNVHDSAMYNMLKEQFESTRNANGRIKDIHFHDYQEAVNFVKSRYSGDTEKSRKIDLVVRRLNENALVSHIPNTCEQDIVTAIWQRSFDPDNKGNANDMRESLADAILDCVEGDHVVCLSGRTKKIWQALAKVDKDPDNGVLKSKQTIRNEIYQRCAKVVDDYVGVNGSASQSLKDAYTAGENTEQVAELTETIRNEIDNVKLEYQMLMPMDQLNIIIEECKQVI